jgi:hypothetical protein
MRYEEAGRASVLGFEGFVAEGEGDPRLAPVTSLIGRFVV